MPFFTDPHFVAMAAMVARATGLPGPKNLPEVADWQAFLGIGRQHRALTLAFPALAQWQGVPDDARAEIRREIMAAARAGLGQMAAQAEISRLLTGAGIRFLVLKGTPLSQLLFADPVRRSSGDIDLLVAPADFAAASHALQTVGYHPLGGMPVLTGDSAQDATVRDLIMQRGPLLLELHQRLTSNPQCLPFGFEELYAARQMVETGGVSLPTLGPAHLGIYLFVHGAGHGWQRLAWLTDIALLCRDPIAAAHLVRYIGELGMTRSAGQAFALIGELLGCPPPPGIRLLSRPARLTCHLAQGYRGPVKGPAWFFQIIFMHWVRWRLRGGFAAFRQSIAYDLAAKSPPGQTEVPGWRLLARPLTFLWRNIR
jgi:hypothetical protein